MSAPVQPRQEHKIYNASSCPICLDEYSVKGSNPCSRLSCGHIFHRVCIQKLLPKNTNVQRVATQLVVGKVC
jgi:hypothetical protein